MNVRDQAEEPHRASETALKISERYGVPPEEVDAIIMDRPVQPGTPHPMTMGALMKDTEKSKGSRMAQPQSRWSPASIIGTVLGILGILALITLLVFILRSDKEPTAEVAVIKDTVFVPVASPLDTLPPEPTIEEAAPEPAPTPKPVVRRRRSTAPAPVLSTSNSLEAEERLAELKAAGNTKARIVRVNRRGTTLYQVRK